MSGAAEVAGSFAALEARALRALAISGRRLQRMCDGRWGVLTGKDRRRRPIVSLAPEQVERLAKDGAIRPLAEDAFVLADAGAPVAAPEVALRWVFVAAAARRPGGRAGGVGFAGLAMLAREGRGPLSLRQVQAGLRLVRDAERAAADARMTMNWDAGPVTRQKRGGGAGGRRGDAKLAARFLHRLRERLGEWEWRLAWALCVEAESLRTLKRRFSISQRDVQRVLAETLEKLAEGYEG
jgi:hypothetical protein